MEQKITNNQNNEENNNKQVLSESFMNATVNPNTQPVDDVTINQYIFLNKASLHRRI